MRRFHQLEEDVNEREDVELQRLEGREEAPPQATTDSPCNVVAAGGVVVCGAAKRGEQLASKKFVNGGFREATKIKSLEPRGGAGLKSKVPKRTEYGVEGEEGDVTHAAAMKEFSILDFGSSHVQDRTIDARMCHVGTFGYWLGLNNYGQYVEWRVSEGMRICLNCAC